MKGGLIAVERASGSRVGRPGGLGQVVVRPAVLVDEFVHVAVGPDEVDVLLVVEGGLIAVKRAASRTSNAGRADRVGRRRDVAGAVALQRYAALVSRGQRPAREFVKWNPVVDERSRRSASC